jgi:hypothetical protein
MHFPRRIDLLIATFASVALLSACEDNPYLAEAIISSDTVTLALPGEGRYSALDIARAFPGAPLLRAPETLADAEQWDVGLRLNDGVFSLRANELTGNPLGLRGAGIGSSGIPFETIDKAPSDLGAYASKLVAIVVGQTYVIRSRQFVLGGHCHKFAVTKVLAADVAAGTARLALKVNELCGDERLSDH